VIFGLMLHHGKHHMFRAMLEAVIFGFRHHLDVMAEAGLHPTRLVATNGGVSSGLWRDIAASVLGQPVTSFRGHPGSSLGVAFLAGRSVGLFDDWSDIDRFLTDRTVNAPDQDDRIRYDRAYSVYRELYTRLADLFPRLS
jgi:xylulokinase